MDFTYSSLMAYGSSNEIQLVVTYDVTVIQFFNIDFKFTFRQCAKTTAWGNGMVSGKESEAEVLKKSIWDSGKGTRTNAIINDEKKKFTYVSTNSAFHGYNNASGANEFIKVTSIDSTAKSYQTMSDYKNRINSVYKELKKDVGKLDSQITVKKQDGTELTLTSDTKTRTYKVIVVVPDSTDMTNVNSAIAALESENPLLDVEVVTGYGDPTPKETETPEKEDAAVNDIHSEDIYEFDMAA